MRPRRFRDLYERRGWRFPLILATEGSTAQGWHGNWRPGAITDLVTMGKYMNGNRWWCGLPTAWPVVRAVAACEIRAGQHRQDVSTFKRIIPPTRQGALPQMFGARQDPPAPGLAPAGRFTGGINRQVGGLPGQGYLVACWMKYEFRGQQPTGLRLSAWIPPARANDKAGIDWGRSLPTRVSCTGVHAYGGRSPRFRHGQHLARASHR